MKLTRNLMMVLGCLLLSVAARSQDDQTAPAISRDYRPLYTDFYVGMQLNSPLFSGDIRSLGMENYFGIGASILGGYSFNEWFSTELVLEYGKGRLGAQNHQKDAYFNNEGRITYVKQNPGDLKLGEVYSDVAYIQGGFRFQVGVLSLLLPTEKPRKFDLELAPAIYLQKYSPKIKSKDDKKAFNGSGIADSGWDYAVGGDLGVSYKLENGVSLFARGSLLWLHNDAFEGINNDPVWRVNLQSNITIGVRAYIFR